MFVERICIALWGHDSGNKKMMGRNVACGCVESVRRNPFSTGTDGCAGLLGRK
jgi:hypothetical protein